MPFLLLPGSVMLWETGSHASGLMTLLAVPERTAKEEGATWVEPGDLRVKGTLSHGSVNTSRSVPAAPRARASSPALCPLLMEKPLWGALWHSCLG